MKISGETIRQAALEHEETCPKAMKDSFYYGFREGAKWVLRFIENNNSIDEEELDSLAESCCIEDEGELYSTYLDGFKAGYRKSKKE